LSSIVSFEKWMDETRDEHLKLEQAGLAIIRHHLGESSVTYLDITHRVKTAKSALEKLRGKKYEKPANQMTDIVGIRVIVYLESDISKVESVLRKSFDVNEKHCVDKRKKSIDQVGYRSVHLVCSLGTARKDLPEYSAICDMPFEIQIRTALEHTWAEIEHKQNYKGQNALPEELQRRLMILAGTLELVDKEFAKIVSEAEGYIARLSNSETDTLVDHISVVSAVTLVKEFAKKFNFDVADEGHFLLGKAVEELANFGVFTNEELQSLLNEVGEKVSKTPFDNNIIGVLRDAMMAKDLDRYLTDAHNFSFTFNLDDVHFLEEVCGLKQVEDKIRGSGADFDSISFDEIGQ
jgi:putative GTP pyrophosphokinase